MTVADDATGRRIDELRESRRQEGQELRRDLTKRIERIDRQLEEVEGALAIVGSLRNERQSPVDVTLMFDLLDANGDPYEITDWRRRMVETGGRDQVHPPRPAARAVTSKGRL